MNKLFIFILACCSLQVAWANVPVEKQANGKLYTGIVVSGSVSAKYNIVFLGDGFTAAEQDLFNTKVAEAVNALRNEEPYRSYLCAFNIWRVNVISEQSGIDHPVQGIMKKTALDCTFGNPANGEPERCITSTSPAKCYEAANNAPGYNAVFILANDTGWGGCESNLVCSSIAAGFGGIITHELGHKIAHLADEYTYYLGNGLDDNERYPGNEPTQANITMNNTRYNLKWGSLVSANTAIPTLNDTPPGIVGLFEGGGYYATGLYRPQWTCLMQTIGVPFCAVCRREMARILSGYCSQP